MEIINKLEGKKLTLELSGRLDTVTAPELDEVIQDSTRGIDELVLDFKNLEYISSAGLRVILSTQKLMSKQGKMVLINVSDAIKDIFDMTGFLDILDIE